MPNKSLLSILSVSALFFLSASPGCGGGGGEICDDGVNNDADALQDCADDECDGEDGGGFTCELGTELTCDESGDNDGDGLADCADEDCADKAGFGGFTCEFGTELSCDDGGDNDGDLDGFPPSVDCGDSDCDGQAGADLFGTPCTCEAGTELSCDDGADNDTDAQVDCDDDDCLLAPNC